MAKITVVHGHNVGWDGRNFYGGDSFIMADTPANFNIAAGWEIAGLVNITVPFVLPSPSTGLDGSGLVVDPDDTLAINVDNSTLEVVNDVIKVKEQGIGGKDIADGALKLLAFAGVAAAGACTLTGVVAGDVVIGVINLSDSTDAIAGFESVITVDDEIQQTSADDLSTKKFAVLIKTI